jgi:hypothetical protein
MSQAEHEQRIVLPTWTLLLTAYGRVEQPVHRPLESRILEPRKLGVERRIAKLSARGEGDMV